MSFLLSVHAQPRCRARLHSSHLAPSKSNLSSINFGQDWLWTLYNTKQLSSGLYIMHAGAPKCDTMEVARYDSYYEICMLWERTRGEKLVYVILPRMVLLLLVSCNVGRIRAVSSRGGRSTHGNNRRRTFKYVFRHDQYPLIGLIRMRDTLLAD